MKLSVITVTWNSASHIAEQIRSVLKAGMNSDYEHIIVDNASSDQTVAIIKSQFPTIRLIENDRNRGFAAANNQAVELATGDVILFLNPDMTVEEKALEELITWSTAHATVGIIGGALYSPQGELSPQALPRRLPRPLDQLAIILKIAHVFPRLLDMYHYHGRDWSKEQRVDSVRGSFLAVKRDLIQKLGRAFDERYFIWFEEVDLCRAALTYGYEVWYVPTIKAVDWFGQSFRQRPSIWRQRQFTQSMLSYFKKWEPWYVWVWIALARPFGIMMVALEQVFVRITKRKT